MGAARKFPSYRLHSSSGQAVVTLKDPQTGKPRDYYLGRHNSEESLRAYDRLVAQWLLTGQGPGGGGPGGPRLHVPGAEEGGGLTVQQMIDAYLREATGPASPYQKAGRPTSHQNTLRTVLGRVAGVCGALPAESFGVAQLKGLRDHLLTRLARRDGGLGWSATFVEKALTLVKAVFRWAAEEGLVSGAAAAALVVVRVRHKGSLPRTPREGKVRAVPAAAVEVTLPHCNPVVAGLARVQYLTAMRPCEAIGLTPGDLDRDGRVPDGPQFEGVWVYAVADRFNKNAHKGRSRYVFLGPKAQAIIGPLLGRPAAWAVFSSGDARGSPAAPGDHYRTRHYGNAIDAGIARARAAGAALPDWNPNQLRHLRATEVAHLYARDGGFEAARAVLGHATPGVTGRYAEDNLGLAARVMREIG